MDCKERKKEQARLYYQKNKERIKAKVKQYRLDNLENKKKYDKEYHIKNKEKHKEQSREYHMKNREKINMTRRKRFIEEKDYRKMLLESRWKSNNIKFFDNTFEKYENAKQCELCNKEIKTKILDHCHLSGYARFITCNLCNIKLGAVDRKKYIMLLEIHKVSKVHGGYADQSTRRL
tara:strand:- start:31 stop:561 length:531 start_codon:yes stop_codon:yes gene_type:complete